MVIPLVALLLLLAFAVCIAAAVGRAPLWVAVLLLIVAEIVALGYASGRVGVG